MTKRTTLRLFGVVLLLAALAVIVWALRVSEGIGEAIERFYFGQGRVDYVEQQGNEANFEADLLAAANHSPVFLLSVLLSESWDAVCFVAPYYAVEQDPKLAGVSIPWIANDGVNTVVLLRDGAHDLYRFDRRDIVAFELTGITANEACYDSTAVSLQAVEGDGGMTLRVAPERQ